MLLHRTNLLSSIAQTKQAKAFLVVSSCVLVLLVSSCSHRAEVNSAAYNEVVPNTLAQSYTPYFQVGAAVNRDHVTGQNPRGAAIVTEHFSVLTAENDMKWESVQPREGEFTFNGADALVRYSAKTNQDVIGHVLVWHSQTPDWVFEDENGKPASRELLLKRMRTHIFEVAGRYRHDIKGWDVVNEALNEDGSLRDSKWLQIIGDDFIDKAFEYAAQAAPDAELYYNDYNLYKASKMDGAIALAQRLRKKGIRIDGIGLQAHYDTSPPLKELEISIQRVIKANLKVMITELDLSVLKFPDEENMGADVSLNFEFKDEYNPYVNSISESSSQRLGQAYIDLFTLFLKYHEHIDRVTLWGVTDENTWRNTWPMKGRTDYPLLFDRDYQPKWFVSDLIDLAQAQ
ncbi:endo-1,4-beta-xylanase [Glaciecola sp. MH2013]|uniref:endo-1,4-beta-xylanase n=1 Tax=Glaciecola sp. MH2013 TaxID=2785524 RepID=UPI0018A0CDD0|nr:endo-1,4-beta-xylanase [Glaciecola sp. MH2013]MBF7071833.1 endo-1,4-beta-xylanase [Glaciecola sp. MH2013]